MHRLLNIACFVAILGLTVPVISQTPPPAPEPSSGGEQPTADDGVNQVVVPLSEPARRWIEQALRRQAADPNAPIPSTGDALLDDVLGVIRRQGSVLGGSSLDERLEQDSRNLLEPSPAPMDSVVPGVPRLDYVAPGDPGATHPDARFHVAESLLRAARELAALPRRDESSDRLIAAMREQAMVLLVDEYSQNPSRFE